MQIQQEYLDGFIKWFVDYAGKNYGYNVETSTRIQIPEYIIDEIYKELYIQWGINDLNLSSHYCNTCHKHDKDYPYHFDVNIVTNVDSPNFVRNEYWEDEDIFENRKLYNYIQEKLKGLTPIENAIINRNAYVFYNLLWRVKEGFESCYNSILVEKDYLLFIENLGIEEINERINEYKDERIVIEADKIDDKERYCLYRRIISDKKYLFSYNCKGAVTWIGGCKTGYVMAKDENEARIKIKEFMERMNGEVCNEYF